GDRLYYIGQVALFILLVEVRQVLTARLLMGLEVEVGPVRDALDLLPPEGELVLHVRRGLRVVRELVGLVRPQPQLLLADPEVAGPPPPLVDPVLEPLVVAAGLDEVLHLHLLELARAEEEVARRDLVAERLADLRDAERDLLARGLLDEREVDEHPLRRLGPQVDPARLVLDGAHVRLEHHVELPGFGEALLAAVRAGGVVSQVVFAEPLVAVQALDERVVEPGDVAARLPDLRGHDDRRLQPDDVVAELHHRTPPGLSDVAPQLDAEGTVVPRRAQPS